TLELLEELLQEYSGTVFLVSHDRTFLNNVVTQTIAFEGDGRWRDYVGGYDDWLSQRPAAADSTSQDAKPRRGGAGQPAGNGGGAASNEPAAAAKAAPARDNK